MINMWVKVIIAEALGLPVILDIGYNIIPIWIKAPMAFVSTFAAIYSWRDALSLLKDNIKKFEDGLL